MWLLPQSGDGASVFAIERRIIIAQSLYELGIVLCIVSTFLSIAFIFLVQLYYAVTPRIFSLPCAPSRKLCPGHVDTLVTAVRFLSALGNTLKREHFDERIATWWHGARH
jgi:hypothetical protein